MIEDSLEYRDKCYKCYRPKISCMCKYVNKIETKTQFIILMHPKEFKKTKNGTGHFTHLALPNSKIFIDVDFTNNKAINEIIENKNNNCYILYPGENSIKLNNHNIKQINKTNVIFIIDSTWPCSKKILRMSKNLHNLPCISFEHNKHSQFKIKTQPNFYCLSTMESTLCIIELLNQHGIETIQNSKLETFLNPFLKMVDYQVDCTLASKNQSIRYKKPYKK